MWKKLKAFVVRIFTKQEEVDYFREADSIEDALLMMTGQPPEESPSASSENTQKQTKHIDAESTSGKIFSRPK